MMETAAPASWKNLKVPKVKVKSKVSYDQIHKPTFFLYTGFYSFLDGACFHPLAVTAVVAELHKVKLPPESSVAPFHQRLRKSLGSNLSIRRASEHLVKGAHLASPSPSSAPPSLAPLKRFRAIYTGFPISVLGLLLLDLTQMIPYTYIKTRLDEAPADSWLSRLPSPLVAGAGASALCTAVTNTPTVLFRLQVQACCAGEPRSLHAVLTKTLTMEGGPSRVLCRGSGVSMLANIPSQAVAWQVYESTRLLLEDWMQGASLGTSFASGCTSGAVTTVLMRPLLVVVARLQTQQRQGRFWPLAKELYRQEGPGAFYKGLGAQILARAPRMGIFYSIYQTFISYASEPECSLPALYERYLQPSEKT